MQTIAAIIKLGPWSKPQQPQPIPRWVDDAAHDLLNRAWRCGGVWVGHGTIEEDAIRGLHELARRNEK